MKLRRSFLHCGSTPASAVADEEADKNLGGDEGGAEGSYADEADEAGPDENADPSPAEQEDTTTTEEPDGNLKQIQTRFTMSGAHSWLFQRVVVVSVRTARTQGAVPVKTRVRRRTRGRPRQVRRPRKCLLRPLIWMPRRTGSSR